MIKATASPNYGYVLDTISIKDQDGVDIPHGQISNNYTFSISEKDVYIEATFKKQLYTITIHQGETRVTPPGPLEIEYLGNQTFEVIANTGYRFIGYKINDGEAINVNDTSFEITNVNQNMKIDIVVDTVKYTLSNHIKDNKFIFEVDEPFTGIKEVKLCIDNQCDQLKTKEYTVENQNIMIQKELDVGDYTIQVTFDNDETSSLAFNIEKESE